jgi:autotransporter-associated beta strand protein
VAGVNGFTFNVSSLVATTSSFGFNLRPGGIVNNDNDVQIFNAPVKLFTSGGGTPTTSTIFTLNNTTSGGGLTFSGTWTSGIAGKETINMNGGAMVVDGVSGTTTTIGTTGSGIISGTLSTLTKNGAGTLILGGTSANTYTGGTIVNSGTVTASKATAFGTGSLTVNGGTVGIGANNQSVGAVIMSGGSITGSSGVLTGSSYSVTNGSISAVLGGGSAALTKSGTGNTVTLSGANTYGGGTTVSGGNLKINNTSGSGTGTGNVIVNSTGILSGTGNISGNVTINSGGTLAPGNSPGTLSTGSQTWNGGGSYLFQINKAGGTAGTDPGWTLANITGSLTLAATPANKFTVSITSLTLGNTAGALADFDGTLPYDWVIATTTTGVTGFDPTAFNIDTSGFTGGINPATGTFSLLTENGDNNLDLVYSVPEPSSLALVFGGGAAILAAGYYRRGRNQF